jgi:phosphoglycerate dehydrogenase-like enzyme
MAIPSIRCLLTRHFWDRDLAYLRSHVTPQIELVVPKGYTPGFLIESAKDKTEILLGDVPGPEALDAISGVKLMQIPWTGIDKLNFNLLEKYRFVICNSHSNAASVAEMGMALLLACMKQIPSHHHAMRQGNWRRPGAADCEMPALLNGKRVGLVGYGAIGKKLARMLTCFDAEVIALASRPRKDGETIVLGADHLASLCSQSDALIISVPLTPETKGMIGMHQFSTMKRNAYLVNISRGEIVDEKALYEVLNNRQIAGAGIDVWYQYPSRGHSISRPSRFPFETLDNLVMSPHRGGLADGELPHMADVVENLNRFASGKPLINCVELSKKY